MITLTVRNHSHFTTLTFPCSENEMAKKLEELDRWDETSATTFVDKVTEPEELSILKGRFIDLDEVAIEKALRRMYSSRFSCDSVRLGNCNIRNDVCKIIFEKILEVEGVFAVNELAEVVKHFRTEEQWDKLAAVAELADVSDSKSLIKLARHLDSFDFIPEVQDQEDLARHWIKAHEEYEISPELEDYFLYEQFGEQIENDTAGMFLPEGGYVYLEEGQSMEEILQDEETEHMMLGGM